MIRRFGVADADDLASEVMSSVLARWADAPPNLEDQRRWVFGFVNNKSREEDRKRRRQLVTETLVANGTVAASPPEDTISGADRVRWLLLQLRQKERDVLYLAVIEGYSISETAAILNITETAVTTRLCRAREHLRTIISSEKAFL